MQNTVPPHMEAIIRALYGLPHIIQSPNLKEDYEATQDRFVEQYGERIKLKSLFSPQQSAERLMALYRSIFSQDNSVLINSVGELIPVSDLDDIWISLNGFDVLIERNGLTLQFSLPLISIERRCLTALMVVVETVPAANIYVCAAHTTKLLRELLSGSSALLTPDYADLSVLLLTYAEKKSFRLLEAAAYRKQIKSINIGVFIDVYANYKKFNIIESSEELISETPNNQVFEDYTINVRSGRDTEIHISPTENLSQNENSNNNLIDRNILHSKQKEASELIYSSSKILAKTNGAVSNESVNPADMQSSIENEQQEEHGSFESESEAVAVEPSQLKYTNLQELSDSYGNEWLKVESENAEIESKFDQLPFPFCSFGKIEFPFAMSENSDIRMEQERFLRCLRTEYAACLSEFSPIYLKEALISDATVWLHTKSNSSIEMRVELNNIQRTALLEFKNSTEIRAEASCILFILCALPGYTVRFITDIVELQHVFLISIKEMCQGEEMLKFRYVKGRHINEIIDIVYSIILFAWRSPLDVLYNYADDGPLQMGNTSVHEFNHKANASEAVRNCVFDKENISTEDIKLVFFDCILTIADNPQNDYKLAVEEYEVAPKTIALSTLSLDLIEPEVLPQGVDPKLLKEASSSENSPYGLETSDHAFANDNTNTSICADPNEASKESDPDDDNASDSDVSTTSQPDSELADGELANIRIVAAHSIPDEHPTRNLSKTAHPEQVLIYARASLTIQQQVHLEHVLRRFKVRKMVFFRE